MTPSIKSVEEIADANLRETITEMLRLIEDASLFILRYELRSSWGEWSLADTNVDALSDSLYGL
jgi:hypothetical protein